MNCEPHPDGDAIAANQYNQPPRGSDRECKPTLPRKLPYIGTIITKTRRAVIAGIGGQDGSYLAELLLAKGYAVHGIVKRGSPPNHPGLATIQSDLLLTDTDLLDAGAIRRLTAEFQPDEVYHLAAPSVVGASWNNPSATLAFMAGSTVNLLDAIVHEAPQARFFHAASSEIFRGAHQSPQNELTPPRPMSPYGVGKLTGHTLVHAYRERHGIHASSGILYNHESPRRPVDFVPSKIVNGAVRIHLGLIDELPLGDLSALRDWGYAVDYTKALWMMLQQQEPDDYVVATGRTHTVKDLVDTAFGLLGLDPDRYVRRDPRFLRKADETVLVGDPSKINERVGWRAETSFDELIGIMVDASLAAHSTDRQPLEAHSDR